MRTAARISSRVEVFEPNYYPETYERSSWRRQEHLTDRPATPDSPARAGGAVQFGFKEKNSIAKEYVIRAKMKNELECE